MNVVKVVKKYFEQILNIHKKKHTIKYTSIYILITSHKAFKFVAIETPMILSTKLL